MATTLAAKQTGNFTSASTWAVVDAGTQIDTEANNVTINTSNVDSPTFTPGAITIDGIGLKIYLNSYVAGATLTMTLRNSSDSVDVASVTVGVDNTSWGGWTFFKFSASQTLLAGKNYIIRLASSSSSSVFKAFHSGSNAFSRFLRTTTTASAAPIAGDKVYVCGEVTGTSSYNAITVTLDNTDTSVSLRTIVSGTLPSSFAIGAFGKLVASTAGSQALYLAFRGGFEVGAFGELVLGDTGTAIPTSTTVTIKADQSTNGDSSFRIWGKFTARGGYARKPYTYLTANASSGQANIVVSDNTNWQNGDDISISPNTPDTSKWDRRTISTQSGTTITCNSNLTNAKEGTSADTASRVLNFTRNILLQGTSSSVCPSFNVFSSNSPNPVKSGQIDVEYVQFKYIGYYDGNGRGVNVMGYNSNTIRYCSIHEGAGGFYSTMPGSQAVARTVTFEYNVVYNNSDRGGFVLGGTGSVTYDTETIRYNVFCVPTSNSYAAMELNNVSVAPGSTISDNEFINWQGTVVYFSGGSDIANFTPVERVKFRFCLGTAIQINANPYQKSMVISACEMWRCRSANDSFLNIQGRVGDLTVCDCKIRGANTFLSSWNSNAHGRFRVIRCTIAGENSTYTVPYAFYINQDPRWRDFEVVGCDFTTGNGIATGLVYFYDSNVISPYAIKFSDCLISSTFTDAYTVATGSPFHAAPGGVVSIDRANRVAGEYRRWNGKYGCARNDTVIYKTASPSERVMPRMVSGWENLPTSKMRSAVKLAAVTSAGGTKTVSVWVRKSASSDSGGADYAGAQPRLMMKFHYLYSTTETDDFVLDTMSVGLGTWEQLSYALPAPAQDCVVEFWVDCDGSAGWINVDDWGI